MRKIGPRNPIVVRITIIVLIAVLTIGILFFAAKNILESNALNYDIGEKEYNHKYPDTVLTSYEEYTSFIKDYDIAIDLKQTDFSNNYYVAVFQEYDSCSEAKRKQVENAEASNASINIDFKIYNKCGWCKSHMILYLVKIDKIDDIDVPINYNYSYSKELDCGNINFK